MGLKMMKMKYPRITVEPKARPSRMVNSVFAYRNEDFRKACAKAGIEPTARQAGKYRRRTGLAWKTIWPDN